MGRHASLTARYQGAVRVGPPQSAIEERVLRCERALRQVDVTRPPTSSPERARAESSSSTTTSSSGWWVFDYFGIKSCTSDAVLDSVTCAGSDKRQLFGCGEADYEYAGADEPEDFSPPTDMPRDRKERELAWGQILDSPPRSPPRARPARS